MKSRTRKRRQLVLNPFVSKAQRAACYAKKDPKWDCAEWDQHSVQNARRGSVDPSQTSLIRKKMRQDLTARFKLFKQHLFYLLVTSDAFGLKNQTQVRNAAIEKVIALDFDGTIATPHKHHDLSKQKLRKDDDGETAVDLVKGLHKEGIKVALWTARDDIPAVVKWLHEHGVEYDYLNDNPRQNTDSRKIQASGYIDDRNVKVGKHSWKKILHDAIKLTENAGAYTGSSLWYWGVNPLASIVVTRNGDQGKEVLLVYKADQDLYTLPGGHLDSDKPRGAEWIGKESALDAAVRELEEETGLKLKDKIRGVVRKVGVYEGGRRDPRDNGLSWTRMYAFAVHLPRKLAVKDLHAKHADDPNDTPVWVNCNRLPGIRMVLDHKQIVYDACGLTTNEGNPYHDAHGRFASGPGGVAETKPLGRATTIGAGAEIPGLSGTLHSVEIAHLALEAAKKLGVVGAKIEHAEHAAVEWTKDKLEKGVGKLPASLQTAVKAGVTAGKIGLYTAFAGYHAAQAFAERVSKERGLTDEQARQWRGTLSKIDLGTFEGFKVGALAGVHAAHLPATITGLIPVASAGYLAYSTARDPKSVARAAHGVVRDGVAKVKEGGDALSKKLESKGRSWERIKDTLRKWDLIGNLDSTVEVYNNQIAVKANAERLLDALQAHHFDDWYSAILSACIDQVGDGELALELADKFYTEHLRIIVNAGQWEFATDADKLKMFKEWLDKQLGSDLLGKDEEAIWQAYVEDGYKKGAGRAFDDVKKPDVQAAMGEKLDWIQGTRQQFLEDAFGQPVAIEKVKLLASRTYNELEGMTDDLAKELTRDLADGLVQGKSPHQIAGDMYEELDISRDRAETIARTEIIRAHAEGQLDAMEKLGVEEVGAMVEWDVADDEKVCELCAPLEGAVFTIEQARGLLPRHPNCRCAWLPAEVGEKDDKKDTKEALEESGLDADEVLNWNPDQPRDEAGRFASTGGVAVAKEETVLLHKREGRWHDERENLHREIVASHFDDKRPVEGIPVSYVMGGGPAAGKSTLIKQGHVVIPENTVHIDVDKIKTQLPEYNHHIRTGDPKAAHYVHKESGHIGDLVQERATRGGYNSLADGTGDSDLENLTDYLSKMRDGGQRIVAHYVTCDTDTAIQRSLDRAKETGRYVPESVIRQTHAGVSKVVPEAVKRGLYDEFTLWDTTGDKPTKVASYNRDQNNDLTIHDADLWHKFVNKGL